MKPIFNPKFHHRGLRHRKFDPLYSIEETQIEFMAYGTKYHKITSSFSTSTPEIRSSASRNTGQHKVRQRRQKIAQSYHETIGLKIKFTFRPRPRFLPSERETTDYQPPKRDDLLFQNRDQHTIWEK